MPLKSPASRGPTKFWSKVLVPVWASDDTILDVLYEGGSIKLDGELYNAQSVSGGVFPDFSVLAQWCIGLRVTSLTFDFEFSDAENCWIREGQLMRARGEI
jgi:hypothetical protein